MADLQNGAAIAGAVNSLDRRAWWDCMVQIAQQADAATRGTTERQVLDANLAGAVRCWGAVTGQDVIQVRDVLREAARAYPLHARYGAGRDKRGVSC